MSVVSFQGAFHPRFVVENQEELRTLEANFAALCQYVRPIRDVDVFVLPQIIIPTDTTEYRIGSSSDAPHRHIIIEKEERYLGISIDNYAFHLYRNWQPDLITVKLDNI